MQKNAGASPQLYNQDNRHAKYKVPVLCLVMEEVHSGQRAGRTAQNCSQKQRLFRYPPQMAAGSGLIHPHEYEACKVDDEQIKKKQII